MKIHIFTVSTGIYNQYIEYQIKSLNNIYPGVEKTWNLISDKEYHLDLNEYKDYTESNYYHISNMPYPFVTYFKTQFMCDMILMQGFSKDDKFIFCDIDTYFIDKGVEFYENLFNVDKLHFGISPHMDATEYDIVECETRNNVHSHVYFGEVNKNTFTKYSQSSLLFGGIWQLFELNKFAMNIIGADYGGYSEIGYIPAMADQSLFNKYIYENDDKIIAEYYISNSYWWDTIMEDYCWGNPGYDKHKDTVFCVQKFKDEIKKAKRYNYNFDYDV